MALPKLPKYRVKKFGWVRDIPDHRDLMFAAPMTKAPLPSAVDLRKEFKTPAYDQGDLGSCTGNAIAGAVQFARHASGEKPDFVPSRLFIYYNERDIEGTTDQDSGAQIRDGMKAVSKLGICPELPPPVPDWPYEIERFTMRPPPPCYDFGQAHQITSYRRIPQILTQMRACLASGFPFVFGFTVYTSFESAEVARTGVVDLPAGDEEVIGGHAVLAMGYDDKAQRFIVRNSWGPKWGENGYCRMPYAYLSDPHLSSDFWTVRLVES